MSFRHSALLYEGLDGFVEGTVDFVRDGLAAGEPVLVAVPDDRVAALRDALGSDAREVAFVDMPEVGRNPRRIIPVWREFVAQAGGRPARGIGEPVWAGRRPEEITECRIHEALLNLAFDGGPSWQLVCPYDVAALGEDVVASIGCTHRVLTEDGEHRHSDAYQDHEALVRDLEALPDPPASAHWMSFRIGDVSQVRALTVETARRAGLDEQRTVDVTLAVSELAANSVRHGGGGGDVAIWHEDGALICEVRDTGRLDDPLAGRHHPSLDRPNGRGLWMVNQLCDLVQTRSAPGCLTVRVEVGERRSTAAAA